MGFGVKVPVFIDLQVWHGKHNVGIKALPPPLMPLGLGPLPELALWTAVPGYGFGIWSLEIRAQSLECRVWRLEARV